MIQTFCFGTMFNCHEPESVAKLAKKAKCAGLDGQVSPETWMAVVQGKRRGEWEFCLPSHVNGRQTREPTRELVLSLVPRAGTVKLKLAAQYAGIRM